jgi:hypothetical protein
VLQVGGEPLTITPLSTCEKPRENGDLRCPTRQGAAHAHAGAMRSALLLLALSAFPAWAVGERIALPQGAPFGDQLKETLCISMECGSAVDANITGKVVKGKAEIKVFSPTGALKATVAAPLNAEGRMSSMDLVAATSAIIAAIEAPEPSKAAAKELAKKDAKKYAAKSKAKKKNGVRLAAKPRNPHTRG